MEIRSCTIGELMNWYTNEIDFTKKINDPDFVFSIMGNFEIKDGPIIYGEINEEREDFGLLYLEILANKKESKIDMVIIESLKGPFTHTCQFSIPNYDESIKEITSIDFSLDVLEFPFIQEFMPLID